MREVDVKLSAGVDFAALKVMKKMKAHFLSRWLPGNVPADPLGFTCPDTDACWE